MKAKNSRYIIGIDLGTTNCALSYIDTFKAEMIVEDFSIKQWAGDESFVELKTMPSFLYRLKKSEVKNNRAKLSWHPTSPEWAVGYGARKMQEVAEQRVVHSAKSWLCQQSVNRLEKFLPFASREVIGDEALSPLEAQAMILEHLKDAWNQEKSLAGEFTLESQEIVITLPASFDEVAQKLTLDAAGMAGYPSDIKLLEEPLSAFYSLDRAHLSLQADDRILVFDMGGGTTDFSLLSVDCDLKVKRDKVSDHILLGGDNIDLLVAKKMEADARQKGIRLSPSQWAQLKVQARVFKEKSFLENEAKSFYLSLAPSGSSLFSKAISLEIAACDVRQMILDGFFLAVSSGEEARKRPVGLKEFGLCYAYDHRVLAHLNTFLSGESFNKVLFAGGSVQSSDIKKKILKSMPLVEEIRQDDHFLSIARGASNFALASRKMENLVVADYARNVFLELMTKAGEKEYTLILKKASRLGQKYQLKDLGVEALLNKRASFNLYTSNEDLDLSVGDSLGTKSNLHALSPLSAKLVSKIKNLNRIKVDLELEIKESALITLFCINSASKDEVWPLYFNLNSKRSEAGKADVKELKPELQFNANCFDMIDSLFGKSKKKKFEIKANHLVKSLEKQTLSSRAQWNASSLREIWDRSLSSGLTRRSRSLEHEITWLYLGAYSLRPGFGLEADSERIDEAWKVFEHGLAHPKEIKVYIPYFLFWRRLSGGLSRQRQNLLFDKFFALAKNKEKLSAELIMLLGSLERLEMKRKIKLGHYLVESIASGSKEFLDAKIWSLSRLCARVLSYGEVENTLHPETVELWVEKLSGINMYAKFYNKIEMFYMSAGRFVDSLELDLSLEIREQFHEELSKKGLKEELLKSLIEFVEPSEKKSFEFFGEELPMGLYIG